MDAVSTGATSSRDGTTIGYRRYGRGPALVVLHGAMESSSDYADLAELLAASFTVYVPDRRGRGLSGPHPAGAGLQTEVDDVRALIETTGASLLFGVSSGGAIALQAALTISGLSRVAVYEPAVSLPGEESHAILEQYEKALERGHTALALVAILKGLQVGPRWLRLLPRRIAAVVVGMLIADEDRDAAPGDVTFGALVPTVRHDLRVADECGADIGRFDAVRPPVLVLGGARSPRYLRAVIDALHAVIPGASTVQLPGLTHTAAANRAQGGDPDAVAEQLLAFFLGRRPH